MFKFPTPLALPFHMLCLESKSSPHPGSSFILSQKKSSPHPSPGFILRQKNPHPTLGPGFILSPVQSPVQLLQYAKIVTSNKPAIVSVTKHCQKVI